MTRMPAGAAALMVATRDDLAFGDDFPTQPIDVPTQPIAVGRYPVRPVLDHRRIPPAHRQPPPPRHHHPASTGGGSHRAPARRPARPARSTVLIVAAVVVAAVTGALGYPSWAAWAPSATRDAPAPSVPATADRQAGDDRDRAHDGALGEADGAVPDGVSVFDDDLPALANLDPGLLAALRRAATDAADDGVEFVVNSGWRSPDYQDHLLDEAISKYGSKKEAARWVATPDTSPHVSGDAVDIGPTAATAWLSRHGADYGLCQIYRNEPWHYELRPDAPDGGCPRRYADPTHDPRMQQ